MNKKYDIIGGMDAAVIYNDEVLPKAKLQGKKSTWKSIFYPPMPIYKVDRDPLSLSLSLSFIEENFQIYTKTHFQGIGLSK